MPITVCVGNYGYYNEGELHDAWITLPKRDQEVAQFLKDHRLMDAQHEEIYISEYDGIPFNTPNLFNEYTRLEDLNLLAKQMEVRTGEVEKVKNALDCGVDGPQSLVGLMNWIEQGDDVPYRAYDYELADSVDEWGQRYIDKCSPKENYGNMMLEDTELGKLLKNDYEANEAFDIERYGELCARCDDVELGEHGYFENQIGMPAEDYATREELQKTIGAMWDARHGNVGGDDGLDLEAEARDARDASASLSDGVSLEEEVRNARDASEILNNDTDR